MSTSTRARVERLERDHGTEEYWYQDTTGRADGLCRRCGTDAPGLTRAQFDALPNNPRRVLVVLEDEPEAPT